MKTIKNPTQVFAWPNWWRHALLLFATTGSLALVLSAEPFAQDPNYHHFADRRVILGMPNFSDVSSNVLFLLVGVVGAIFFLAERKAPLRVPWLTFFLGVAIISLGSSYYHWNPNDTSLVWDRLPMTTAFMALFAALLGEYVSVRLGKTLLVPALLLGFFSVLYWYWFNDLRLYFWVQLMPLLTIPLLMILFRSRFTRPWVLLVAVGLYVLAKASEAYDIELYAFTQNLFSGHTLKHVLAASSCFAILMMLKLTKPKEVNAAS